MSSINYVKTYEPEDASKLLFEDLLMGLIMLNFDANISMENNYILNFVMKKKIDFFLLFTSVYRIKKAKKLNI